MIAGKSVTAILPAAGVGKRMVTAGHRLPKQFLEIAGVPILTHTLRQFESCDSVDHVTLVCEESMLDFVATEIVEAERYTKIRKIVRGGKERQDSVYSGFCSSLPSDYVVVHDVVRPFVSQSRITEVLEEALRYRAAILAVPAKDTIKAQDDQQFVERTLDRSVLWNVQTPQAFEYGLLREAFENAYAEDFYGTDESSLVEALGVRVRIVPGDYENIKITSPEDLIIAEAIAKKLGRA